MKKKALVWAELHGLQFLQGMLICSSALQKMQGSLFSSAWSTSSLSFSDLGAHRAVSNFFFLLLLFFYFFFFSSFLTASVVFCTFLNTFSARWHQFVYVAQLW